MKKTLIDIGHPAHVHLFRNYIQHLQETKQKFVVVSRDKEITNQLLEHYQIPYSSISKQTKGLFNMLVELIIRNFRIFKLHWKHNFKSAIGTSVSIGHLSFLTFGKVKSYNFNEDDDDIVPLYTKITYPFSTKIVCPDCLRFTKWKNKRVTYPSYHELSYLHPNNFTPDESVLEKYGLKKRKYVIFRLSALIAHHDHGVKGISGGLKEKMLTLLDGYDIIESLEGKRGNKIEPWDMHHVLAFSKMIISDSQTMSAEGMVLGVPSFRINSFVGRISYLEELENEYNLGFGILPDKENEILSKIKETLSTEKLEELWSLKKRKMLEDKIDLNQWMIDYFEINRNE
jgi:predicted glycosyltransferase